MMQTNIQLHVSAARAKTRCKKVAVRDTSLGSESGKVPKESG